jgi:hypothetical protein
MSLRVFLGSGIEIEPTAVEVDRRLEPLASRKPLEEYLIHWILAFSPAVLSPRACTQHATRVTP